MSRPIFICCLVVSWCSAVAPLAAAGRCWVVAVAMNQDAQASEDWNQYGEEFALAFRNHGSGLYQQVQVKTVLGREARLGAIASALNWGASNAKQGDLLAIYIGAHGGTSPKQGWSTDTMDGRPLLGRDLKLMASRLPCPVLFVIDTCGSGGFAREHDQDIALPSNCVAICSSRAQQSTTNVLNTALHEGLWGMADVNRDEYVTVGELTRYVQARCRRIAPPGETVKESEVPVVVTGADVTPEMNLIPVTGELVAVLQEGNWLLARITGEDGELYKLHVMGAQDDPSKGFFVINEAPQDRVFRLTDGLRPVLVEQGERTRPALLVSVDGEEAKIRFPLAKKRGEVTVQRDQLQFPFPIRGPQGNGTGE